MVVIVNTHSSAAPVTLSQRYWGLEWSSVLPWQFDDITVESATFDEAMPFIKEHYARIFGGGAGEARFLASPMTAAKHRFCAETDIFLFRAPGRIVGLFMAHPSDWSTYYIRSVAVLPEFRERRLLTRFMEHSYAPLARAGVERVEAECSPGNTPVMRVLVGQGFFVTSTANSERWGATVRFTKFLAEEAETVFVRQFNSVTRKKKELTVTPHLERSTS